MLLLLLFNVYVCGCFVFVMLVVVVCHTAACARVHFGFKRQNPPNWPNFIKSALVRICCCCCCCCFDLLLLLLPLMQVKFEDEERDDERSIRIRRSTQWQLTNARNVAFVLLLFAIVATATF